MSGAGKLAAHTPGPWSASAVSGIVGSLISSPEGNVAAAMPQGSHQRFDKERTEANARLIAAAPDLLEACRKWVDLYPGHKTGDCTPPGCAVCRCRAAIAKAEGR